MRHWNILLGALATAILASSAALAADEVVVDSEIVEATTEVAASDPLAVLGDVAVDDSLIETDVESLAAPEAMLELAAEVGSIAPPASPAASAIASPTSSIVLGPEGQDTQGRVGRIHTVARGDTLWDISEAYLGTAWVWPSVWQDNRVIDDPHQIKPGDRIWISSNLMRPITEEEAAQFIAADLSDDEETGAALAGVTDVAEEATSEWTAAADEPVVASAEDEDLGDETEVGSRMQDLPVSVPDGDEVSKTGKRLRVSWVEGLSILRGEVIDAATAIVGSALYRTFYAQGDEVYVGLSEDGVAVGDQYSFFREEQAIHDQTTGNLIGYHVEILGWGEVTEVHSESAVVAIKHAVSELASGDRVVPRVIPETELELRSAPDGLEGEIVYLPDHRATMGMLDYVFVNRGAVHGVEPGMQLEVYDMGGAGVDVARRTRVALPDIVTAQLVVVRVTPDTAVALVTESTTEVEVGNVVRARSREMVRR